MVSSSLTILYSIFALANGTTLDRDAACRIGVDIWNTDSFTDKLTWPLTKDSSAHSGTLTLRMTKGLLRLYHGQQQLEWYR